MALGLARVRVRVTVRGTLPRYIRGKLIGRIVYEVDLKYGNHAQNQVNNDLVVNDGFNFSPIARDVNPAVITNTSLSVEHSNPYKQSVVTIPEDLALSESEMSVLSKGLNFIPVSK